jgi:hypothetical protein
MRRYWRHERTRSVDQQACRPVWRSSRSAVGQADRPQSPGSWQALLGRVSQQGKRSMLFQPSPPSTARKKWRVCTLPPPACRREALRDEAAALRLHTLAAFTRHSGGSYRRSLRSALSPSGSTSGREPGRSPLAVRRKPLTGIFNTIVPQKRVPAPGVLSIASVSKRPRRRGCGG